MDEKEAYWRRILEDALAVSTLPVILRGGRIASESETELAQLQERIVWLKIQIANKRCV